MLVIKRDGRKQKFNKKRIENAIHKAYNEVYKEKYISFPIHRIAKDIEKELLSNKVEEIDIETIQDMVIKYLNHYSPKVARAYKAYREDRAKARENTTDKDIIELIGGNSEYWNTENSNKNATLVTTQRDYLAGIVSTDMSRRKLLPKDVVEAHDNGLIHFHK